MTEETETGAWYLPVRLPAPFARQAGVRAQTGINPLYLHRQARRLSYGFIVYLITGQPGNR